jgi:hypothetical protein
VSAPDELDRLAAFGSEPFCYITTTGRRTGRPHTIEIWFGLLQGTVYVLSGGGDRSDWVRNIKARRSVGCRSENAPLKLPPGS